MNDTKTVMNNTVLTPEDGKTLWNLIVALNKSKCDENEEIESGSRPTEMDAFLYIVVVLGFYASSIVLLLIKYSRKDDEEKFLNNQFSEFVKRDKFQSTTYQNRLALVRTQEVLANMNDDKKVPQIKIQECGDSEEKQQTVDSVTIDIPAGEGNISQSSTFDETIVTVDNVDVNFGLKEQETHDMNNANSGINDSKEKGVTVNYL